MSHVDGDLHPYAYLFASVILALIALSMLYERELRLLEAERTTCPISQPLVGDLP